MEFTVAVKVVKFLEMKRGIRIHHYLDDWLVRARSHQTCVQHTQTLIALCQELGWLVNKNKSELDPKQVFNFVGYQFDLKEDRVRPTPERWQALQTKIRGLSMPGPETNVPNWATDCYRETTALRPVTHKTHTMASQKQLEGSRDNGKGRPHPKVTPLTSEMVAGGRHCTHRSTITPTKTCSADLYRGIKRRVVCSLKRAQCKGILVTSRKQTAHKLSRAKSGPFGLKEFQGLCANNTWSS